MTITEIEQLTGLEFDERLFDSNPLYYYPREGINKGPEGFVAPSNTKAEELDKGIVFNRCDAESDKFKSRKRNISEEVFIDYIGKTRDI